MPVVGASGAISGVMAAYAILFPNARLVSLIWVVQVQWKTSTYLGVWLLLQFLRGFDGRIEHVAWWAHIGGFAAGAAIAWQWRATQP
jgi:membrane associated rhomboid family serine protease